LMRMIKLDLAAEYMVMAALLAEIKSRMLLPRPVNEEGEEEDPRAQLVRRLQEYERYRQAAADIDALPQTGREIFVATVPFNHKAVVPRREPNVQLHELLDAFKEVLTRAERYKHLRVDREVLSVRERMTQVLDRIRERDFIRFEQLFDPREGRMGVVVTFVALLELLKDNMVMLVQNEPFAPIHVKAVA
jgi:segregation and condensation protein A